MCNFCINCGAKIRKDDNYCMNCGTKIRKDYTYCTNCGNKLRKDDNFCTNCGTKIDKSNINQHTHLKSAPNHMKKKNSEISKENEEKIKIIDGLFESEEIKSEIRKNKIDQIQVISIKESIKNKLINKKEKMIKGEIKYLIKTELKKAHKEPKRIRIVKERRRERKKLIDELFESEEIKSEIRKNKIDQITAISIKDSLKNKIIDNKSENEIKQLIINRIKKANKITLEKQLKEKEMRNKKIEEKILKIKILKIVDELFKSEEIQSEIRINNIDSIPFKKSIKDKLINKRKNMFEGEIKYFIKNELEKIRIAKEKEENIYGGYCSSNCRYFRTEYLNDHGVIAGCNDDCIHEEYYCMLGHNVHYGSFCKDYY